MGYENDPGWDVRIEQRIKGGVSFIRTKVAPRVAPRGQWVLRNPRGRTAVEEVVAEGGVDFRYAESGPEGDPGAGQFLMGVGLGSGLWATRRLRSLR